MPRLGCFIGAVGGRRAIPSASTGPRPGCATAISAPPSTSSPLPPLPVQSRLKAQTVAAAWFCSVLPSTSYAFPDQNIDSCEVPRLRQVT
ncbi:hypothetical protein PVAP13_3NG303700 [Panicum virgatum]|uniref:Uncharacterized protein n=1 Tax=Panicum virgatum TaxID=38727 RepID=A0A8T0UGN8_PANVG|nr:hypothetical protein PVAP13_3NG303700 [Panicum virgatum]KAG2621720.1 hypothetical protein PVAP13_3NG303700 [Panicum virgatum]